MIDFRKKTFLVADSSQESRLALGLTLSILGANRVENVSQSKQVIRRLTANSYDIIICDYNFGQGIDGFALLQELSERNLIKPSSLFIIVTGESSSHNVLRALEYSPDDYILKPFNADTLMKRLEKAAQRKSIFATVGEMVQKHDYAQAIAECDKKIREGSVHKLDFMKLKARLSMITADYEGAQKVYEQVLETQPVAWATMGLGKSLHQQKDYEKAVSLFESIITDNSLVMDAYDWLADSHKSNGNPLVAQEVLQKAVAILPNDLKRQQALGEVAWENGDMEVAEKTFRQCMALGKQQIATDPDNHVKLSKVLLEKGDTAGALATLQELRKDLAKEPQTALYASLIECMIYQKTGEKDKAQPLYVQVKKDYAESSAELPISIVLDMISASLLFQDDANAEAIVRKLLRNNVDSSMRNRVIAIYEKAGQGERIQTLIESIKAELVDLNNRAVILAKGGDLKGAVDLFIKAVADMPNNVIFIINATNALLAYVNLSGWDEAYMKQANEFIERIAELDPINPAYQQLKKMCASTTKKFALKSGGAA